jgi:aldehyde dehydrogenase (NAD+)
MTLWFDTREILIGGRWLRTAATLPVEDPSTGATTGEIARGQAADIDAAPGAARRRPSAAVS